MTKINTASQYIVRDSYKKGLSLIVSVSDDITGQTKTLTLDGYDAMEVSEAIKAGNPALRLIETPKGVKITYRVEDQKTPAIPEKYR